MRAVTAQWIANAVGGTLVAPVDTTVTSVEKDSRDVREGSMYVAFIGEHVDGHQYASQAVAAGASLCLVSQPVDAPHIMVDDVTMALGKLARAYLADLRLRGDVTVVGITGSNGKTSTKDLLAQILPDVVAPEGSFNNEIGLPLTILRADDSTRHLVLEMGASAPGDIAYLTDIAPLDIGVVLTVGAAHVGAYGSLDKLAIEKSTLLSGVIREGVAILNADDPRVRSMATSEPFASSGVRVRFFGSDTSEVDLHAGDIALRQGRPTFVASGSMLGGAQSAVDLQLVGEHHVTNALAALAVALECGLNPAHAASLLSRATPLSAHRMALTQRPDGVVILDDSYNASPESMRAALRALMSVAERGRTFAVIGEMREMGDASVGAHADVGHDVVRLGIDHLVVVGKGAKPAFDSAVREGSWGDEALYVDTIDEAHRYLTQHLEAGDTVLLKASHGSQLWKLADAMVGDTE